jgi:penicillin amidase
MKILKILSVAIFVLAIGLVAFWQIFFRLPIPGYTGTNTLPGLKAEVRVKTDQYGVPHIFAKDEDDLFYAQGYITARERMFQMEVTRLAGRGELSSLFGERTADQDRFLKTVGFNRLARSEYETTSPELKRVIEAYVDGVNACITETAHLPREFVILGARPQLWKPEDSIAAGLLMAYSLTRSKKSDLILYQAGRVLPKDLLDLFIPSYPDFAPTVSAGSKPTKKAAIGTFHDFADSHVRPFDSFEPFSLGFPASNWMIFAGSRTTTGHPLFTGSPDLEPKLPALFYVVHLKGGRFDVMGGSLPGTPAVSVLGYNGQIAWSTVNGRVDELDYFIEKVNPDNPNQYLTEEGWRNFKIVEETLKIKTEQAIKEERLEVKISRHGPVVSGALPLAPDHCAMQWVGFEPSGIFEGFLRICLAGNFEAFRKAASLIRTPSLNLGYADRNGHIGYQYVARPPIRKAGDGTLPVPGWTGEYDWTGYVPVEDLPYELDPDKGYFGSFNNEAKPTPYHMTNYYLFERALRFEEIMKNRGKVSLEEARALQLDTVSEVARRWTPLVLKVTEDKPDLNPYMELFKGWNYAMDFESPAATLFNAFIFKFMANSFADELGDQLWSEHMSHPYISYIADLALIRIMDDPHHVLWDDVGTKGIVESRDDIILKSVKQALNELITRYGEKPDKWLWGHVHQMTFKHPLGSKLTFMNLDPIPTQGDGATINAGMWNPKDPYSFESGGVIRMVVDFADPENSTIISPPGQSGHYKSAHYADQAQPWARGRQIPMHFLTAEELDKTLTLNPGQPK